MKKLYILMMLVMATVMTARAAEYPFTLTDIQCNDPDHVTMAVYTSGVNYPVNLYGEPGDDSWSFTIPDGNASYIYYNITPADGYKVEYYFADADGNKLISGTVEATVKKVYFNIKSITEGTCTLTVSESVPDASYFVTINGKPEKVAILDNISIKTYPPVPLAGLTEGRNEVQFVSSIVNRVYLTCDLDPDDDVINDGIFYRVTVDGVEVKYSENVTDDSSMLSGDGGVTTLAATGSTYNYQFTIKDGTEIVIDTEFEGDPCLITVYVTNDQYDFIEAVYYNSKKVEKEEWMAGFYVDPGSNVSVVGNERDYKVSKSMIGSKSTTDPQSTLSSFVFEDTQFAFAVSRYERPNNLVMWTPEGSGWTIITNNALSWTYGDLYQIVDFADNEAPLTLSPTKFPADFEWGDSEDVADVLWVYYNDEQVIPDEGTGNSTFAAKDGGVLKAVYGLSAPTFYDVTYAGDDEADTPEVIRDRVVKVDTAAGHRSLAGTEVTVAIPANAGDDMDFALFANGAAVEAIDGVFTVVIEGDTKITWTGSFNCSLATITAAEADVDAPLYNLQGVRVNRATAAPGLYIQAGKKILL